MFSFFGPGVQCADRLFRGILTPALSPSERESGNHRQLWQTEVYGEGAPPSRDWKCLSSSVYVHR